MGLMFAVFLWFLLRRIALDTLADLEQQVSRYEKPGKQK